MLALPAFLLVWMGGPALADPPAQERDLKRQIEELERKNAELEKRVQALEEEEPAEASEELLAEEEEFGLGLVFRYGDVEASFNLFGDVGFEYQNPEEEDRSNAFFALGSLVLFGTGRLGDRFHVLSETVIEGKDDDSNFTQERLWGSWSLTDLFYAKLGLEHAILSRWNRLYHHGRWLEISIDRPFLARFEGDNGILPLHDSGLELGGSGDAGLGRWSWVGVVSNGRGEDPTEKQRAIDRNDAKAVSAGLAFEPYDIEDLRLGVAFRHDDIPRDRDSTDPARAHSIGQQVASGYIAYKLDSVEALAEIAWIEDEVRATDQSFQHHTGYVQVAWRRKEWTPYTRFDYRDMESGDPFYEPLDRDLDEWRQILGIRYDFVSNAAAKLELGIGRGERRDEADVVSRKTVVTVGFQLSWAF